jgi:transposase
MPHIEGVERGAVVLFPQSLDEYISEDNPVRFIDAFVDQLDLEELGFERAVASLRGRPAYHPADLLKLYVYGYLNRVRSSRLLEREAGRNVELIWLLKKLSPDFKTIADFRKDNLEPLKQVCRSFTLLCKDLDLFGCELVAIDGSKFKAQNNVKRTFTADKLTKLLARIEQHVENYLAALDAPEPLPKTAHLDATQLRERLVKLRERHEHYTQLQQQLAQSEETQISLTDSDSRLMRVGQGTDVCYNVQFAVDAKHKLIIAHDAVSDPTDHNQLEPLALAAKATLGVEKLEVVADMGYTNAEQFERCEKENITLYIPKSNTSRNQHNGLFTKMDFVYDSQTDAYECPQGETLRFRFETVEKGRATRYYTTTACQTCPLKALCTKRQEGRRITRSAYEAVAEKVYARVRANPLMLERRKEIVEHIFGTLKRAMVHDHFLLRTRLKVRAEVSVSVLTYNIKRVMTILGVPTLLAKLKTLAFACFATTRTLSLFSFPRCSCNRTA